MVLAGIAGYLLERFAGLPNAVVPALLLGLFGASLVRAGGSCAPGQPTRSAAQQADRR